MISICTTSYNIAGQLISASGFAEVQLISRRAKRVATLDGFAVLVDGGFSAADLTYNLQLPDGSGDHHLALTTLLQNYPSVILSCSRGCYLVLLSALDYDNGITTCDAEVLEDLS